MSDITEKLWKKYWGNNNEIANSKALGLINSYLEPVSDSDKEKLLSQPISMFRSVSVLFRWIYFILFKDDEIEPEIVAVVSPLDLPELDIKNNILFKLRQRDGDLEPGKKFKVGDSKCPNCGNTKFLEDNRIKKKQNVKFANIPDFSCSNFREKNGCGWGGYINSSNDSKKVPAWWVATDENYYLYNNESRNLFYEWNKSQIKEINVTLKLYKYLYDSKNSKFIQKHWLSDSDEKAIEDFKENNKNIDEKKYFEFTDDYEQSLLTKVRKFLDNE